MVHGYIKGYKKMLMLWGKHEHIKLNTLNTILILGNFYHNFNHYF